MNSGVMDVLLSRELPPDVTHLAQILRTGVTSGMIDPFHCRITGQDGSQEQRTPRAGPRADRPHGLAV